MDNGVYLIGIRIDFGQRDEQAINDRDEQMSFSCKIVKKGEKGSNSKKVKDDLVRLMKCVFIELR